MKRYIFLFITTVAIGFLNSCNDQLDLDPDGRITMDQVFSDRYRTMGYLNSCYGYCPAPYMDRASMCDEAEDADDNTSGSRYSAWYSGSVTANTYPSYSVDGSPWASLYEGIRKCNVFLANIWTSTAYATADEKKGWAAQAHTLRALYYLQLIKRYGSVPVFDKPLGTDHDFSKDTKSSFSEVVKFILADCDSALKAPATQDGFHWEVYNNQFGMMTRAVPYAIMSEAVTYAASPLWSDGTFSWADATAINKEALYQCLTHDYKLFDDEPVENAAQNAYALYFITNSDDQRSVDKETILQVGGQMAIWKYAGLPTTAGMDKAGPCPTQELVDCYEMANGLAPILGYSDANHLNPIINRASGYDPEHPYEGRDPRFYASVYYNGAPKNLQAAAPRNDAYNLNFTATTNELEITEVATGSYELTTTGGDPYVYLTPLAEGLNNPPSVVFAFEYMSSADVAPQLFLGPAIAESRSTHPATIPSSSVWTTYSADITAVAGSLGWGNAGDNIRFDLGGNSGVSMKIKNIRIEVKSSGYSGGIETFVGGAEEISQTNRTHTRTGYYMRKFNNWKSGLNNNADGAVRLFRLAELYLNFAESAYQSNGPDTKVTLGPGMTMSARDAVNAVRARAGMPDFPAGMSADDFKAKYRNERRVELAFEEHRYFDVRRWKILDQTDKFVTGMEITKNGTGLTYTRFKFDNRNCSSDKWLLYPINQDDVVKVIGINGNNWQNPGW